MDNHIFVNDLLKRLKINRVTLYKEIKNIGLGERYDRRPGKNTRKERYEYIQELS